MVRWLLGTIWRIRFIPRYVSCMHEWSVDWLYRIVLLSRVVIIGLYEVYIEGIEGEVVLICIGYD